jgi:hypothetical protein
VSFVCWEGVRSQREELRRKLSIDTTTCLLSHPHLCLTMTMPTIRISDLEPPKCRV